MVAPYEIGDPVRSFVRVTGTGSDKTTEPICWDLSRGSTAAGAAPVSQTLPRATPITTLLKPEGYAEKEEAAVAGSSPQPVEENTNQAAEEPQAQAVAQAVPEPISRKRRVSDESGILEASSTTPEPPVKCARVSDTQEASSSGAQPSTSEVQDEKVPPVAEKIVVRVLEECSRLSKENGQLRKENANLKEQLVELEELRRKHKELEERVTLFHDLFKNKKRLSEFVRSLGISTATQ